MTVPSPIPLRRIVAASLLVTGLIAGPALAAEPRRVALVVGNGAYRHVEPLANPANDARLIAATLRGLGFELVGGGALLDLDKARLDAAVSGLRAATTPGSVALFYYSGHGVRVDGINYLAPVDTAPQTEADAARQMVSASAVLQSMARGQTDLNIVVLDACRNNPFRMTDMATASSRGIRSADPAAAARLAVTEGLAEMRAPPHSVISFATQPGAVASDGVAGAADSPYTTALSRWLRAPGLTVEAAFSQAGQEVARVTHGAQDPWLLHTGGGEGLILTASGAAAAAAPAARYAACPPAGLEAVRNAGLTVRYEGSDPAAADLCHQSVGGAAEVQALGIWPASWPGAMQAAATLRHVLAGQPGATEDFSVSRRIQGGAGPSETWRFTLTNDGPDTLTIGATRRLVRLVHWEQTNIGHPYTGRVDLALDAATGAVVRQTYRLVTGGDAWAYEFWSSYGGGLQAVPDFYVTALRGP